MKITIPIKWDSDNTNTEDIELVFQEDNDGKGIYVYITRNGQENRSVSVSKNELIRAIKSLELE